MAGLQLVEDPVRVRAALSPLRRRLLELLREPRSATEAAATLGETRQKVNYHLRVLEDCGLVQLVELRQRRGFTERVLQAQDDLVVDPAVIRSAPADTGGSGGVTARDRHAAVHLVATAERTVREVTRMQQAAQERGQRLLTLTIEAEVRFGSPHDVHRFTDELAGALARIAAGYDTTEGAAYRLTVAAHPAPLAPPPSGDLPPAAGHSGPATTTTAPKGPPDAC